MTRRRTPNHAHYNNKNKGVPIIRRLMDGSHVAIIHPDIVDEHLTDSTLTEFGIRLTQNELDELEGVASSLIMLYQHNEAEIQYAGLRDGALDPESVNMQAITAPDPIIGIWYALNNLEALGVSMPIGGLKVIYDTGISEIITVAAAHIRGYTDTFASGAVDSDIFLVIHVIPSDALADSNYGVDIIDGGNFHGKLEVFGGKVVRDTPKPDLSFTYQGNPAGDASSDAVTDIVNGSYFHTTLPLPIISGVGIGDPSYGTGIIPSNCCNGGAQPPVTPITPEPPIPLPVPTPKPNKPVTSDTMCSEVFSQSGQSFDFWSDLVSFGARVYGNRSVAPAQYPLYNFGTLIHDWIVANVGDFDFTCDTLISVNVLLHMTHTDPRIFGVINNPFGSNNVTPRVDNWRPIGGIKNKHESIYYFQPDSSNTSFLGPTDIIVNRYTKFIYENSHKITVRAEDRLYGWGAQDWGFYIDESDIVDAASVDPLSLQICGIDYKKHQYLFSFKFDGTDPVKIIGGVTYIYDQHENARIPVPTGYFETDGIIFGGWPDTGFAVHGGAVTIELICPPATAGTKAFIYGKTEVVVPNSTFDSTHFMQIARADDHSIFTNGTAAVAITHDAHTTDFSFECDGTFDTSHTWDFVYRFNSFNPGNFILHAITGFMS